MSGAYYLRVALTTYRIPVLVAALVSLTGVVILLCGAEEAGAQTSETPFVIAAGEISPGGADEIGTTSGSTHPSTLVVPTSGIVLPNFLTDDDDDGGVAVPFGTCLLLIFLIALPGRFLLVYRRLPKPASALPSPLERPG